MVEGAVQHAIGFATLEDVRRVDAALEHLSAVTADPSAPRPVVSVVGAGYSGVELAATVAERMAGAAAVHLLSPSGDVMPVRPLAAGSHTGRPRRLPAAAAAAVMCMASMMDVFMRAWHR